MTSKNTKPAKNLRDLPSFDDFIAQRADAVGADGGTVQIEGFGKTWNLNVPALQSADWNDRFQELTDDVREEVISPQDFRHEFGELLLGEQKDDFFEAADKAGIDPLVLLRWALENMAEAVAENPFPQSSRSTRPRAKRR
ncbi:hypothetical protein [Corynebacterium bouchesdurhonense]|uniref:hypothetical protein n=1 Tax=Corynebacterium bouchesdurhonense TaxID=1720192 RepID=UPI000831ABB4|nr:hypothetical protein [Corynebacterium bouchesdurhonense]